MALTIPPSKLYEMGGCCIDVPGDPIFSWFGSAFGSDDGLDTRASALEAMVAHGDG